MYNQIESFVILSYFLLTLGLGAVGNKAKDGAPIVSLKRPTSNSDMKRLMMMKIIRKV